MSSQFEPSSLSRPSIMPCRGTGVPLPGLDARCCCRRVSLQPGRAEQRCLDLVRMVVLVIWFYDDGPMNLVTVVVAIVVVLVVMMVLMAVMVRTTMILLMGEA